MITAQTITHKYHKDARCITATQKDGLGTDYFLIVDDAADDPILAWGYSVEEAWDYAAKKLLGEDVRSHARQARKDALNEAAMICRKQSSGSRNPKGYARGWDEAAIVLASELGKLVDLAPTAAMKGTNN